MLSDTRLVIWGLKMTKLSEICGEITEAKVVPYRYYVVLKTELPGFKLYLATNATGVSQADVVQTVRHHLEEVKDDFQGVMRQQWDVATVTPIRPSEKAQQLKRLKNKKKG